MSDFGHVCSGLPRGGRKQWWTCPDCGQVWHRSPAYPGEPLSRQYWRLSPREAQQ